MGLILLYLLIALGVSFLCSILEAVLLSITTSYITLKECEDEKSAKLLKKLKTNIDRPIAAILSINTIAHTIGAAGVGAEATNYFGAAYFGVVSAVLTLLILVFSEIIPKTIGARYWKSLAIPSAKIINFLIIICYPLVLLSELITKLFTRNSTQSSISREEVSAIVQTGASEGVLETKENRIIQNLIKLGNVDIKTIMTPRTVTSTANEDSSVKDFFEDKSLRPYSRIPIYEKEADYITGYVLSKDVLEYLSADKFDLKLAEIKRSIMIINEIESVSVTWKKMLENREHIALVVNEYGTFDGIVTMEDIVETLLGLEIVDENDTVVDMQKLARDRWTERLNRQKRM